MTLVSKVNVTQSFRAAFARVVTRAPRFTRSVLILNRLHWLPVKLRIHFQICTLTFRTLKYNLHIYLADLIARPKCSKYLRSTNSSIHCIFFVPHIKSKSGWMAFSVAGPASWNALPVPIGKAQTILTFRKLFNSHLIWLSRSSSLGAPLHVDEPALAWIMIHDHAKDLYL